MALDSSGSQALNDSGTSCNFNDILVAVTFLAMIPFCASVLLWNTGQFGQTQLVVGSIAVLLFWLNTVLLYFNLKRMTRLLSVGDVDVLGVLPISVLVRWLQLGNDNKSWQFSVSVNGAHTLDDIPAELGVPSKQTTEPIQLLEHDPANSDLCPCPLPTSAGRLGMRYLEPY